MASTHPDLSQQFSPVFQLSEWHGVSRRRYPLPLLLLALLLHLAVLLVVLQHTSLLERPHTKGDKDPVSILYFPQQLVEKLLPPAPPPPKPQPQVHKTPPPPRQHTPQVHIQPRHDTPPLPPPVNVEQPAITQPPPEEDMMARVEAARKRREAARASETPAAPVEDENPRRLQNAYANLASIQQKAGRDKDDTGGVFQIRHQGYHDAEFVFRGWNATMRRMWPQQYQVEQGQEPDIEMAIVKKMIEVIRKYKDGDFVWESHRLGRSVTLSARVADTAQLQQFLLREFFPNYRQQ